MVDFAESDPNLENFDNSVGVPNVGFRIVMERHTRRVLKGKS